MIRTEDGDDVGTVLFEPIEILKDGVGGAAIPAVAGLHLRRHRGQETVTSRHLVRPRVLQVLEDRLRLVLREDVDGRHVRVDEVAQDEVDKAIAPAERHGRLGAVARERVEPLAATAGHDEREDACPHWFIMA